MYLRTKRVRRGPKTYEYLALCESFREGGHVRQRVICNLGRKDLLDPREIDAMIRTLDPLAGQVVAVDTGDEQQGLQATLQYGPLPILRRLWEDLHMGGVLRKVMAERGITAPLDQAAFAMVAARFVHPASKRDTFRTWLKGVYAPELQDLSLHHLYRALDLLDRAKDRLERTQWARVRTLFHPGLDLVLVDTTNTYVHGGDHATLAQYGKSKERRFDRKLISVGLLVTRDGVPIGHEVFPGNVHDAQAFTALLKSLQRRVAIDRVVLCADRGMVSEEILAALRAAKVEYVVGSKLTRKAEAALTYPGAPWQTVEDLGLRVKEMTIEGETYVVVHNPEEEVHDRERRKEILRRLRAQLKRNPSGSDLWRHSLYRPYVKVSGQVIRIHREAIERQRRLDGKYVLRANTRLEAADIARVYRQLWRVERAFRELKGPFELRPVYHWVDRRIRGHLVVCFLAYVLEMALRQALGRGTVLDEKGYRAVMADLRRLTVAEVVSRRGRYFMRTPLLGRAHEAFSAAGMRVPPRVLETKPPPSAPAQPPALEAGSAV